MAHDEEYEYIMEWSIENYNYFWHNKGENLFSPIFAAILMENTKWRLILYPSGDENDRNISYKLYREVDEGPENIVINYCLEVLGKDSSALKTKCMFKETFTKGLYSNNPECLAEKKQIMESERNIFLPINSLTILCKIARNDKRSIESEHVCAKTVINIEKRSFKWAVQEFKSLLPYRRIPFTVESPSKATLMWFSLFLSETEHFDETILIDVTWDIKIKYCGFKMFLVDNEGRRNECGQRVFWNDMPENRGIFPLHLTKKKLLEKKDFYLKEDVLSLYCECFFPRGISLEGIVSTSFELTSPQTKRAIIRRVPQINVLKNLSDDNEDLIEDFEALYKDGFLSDIELCSGNEYFPAHTVVLCARSQFFRTIIANEMKIGKTIDVSDLDHDTINRMLLYMYTGILKDLNWESAFRLYQASQKYKILDLRYKCGEILRDQICPTNACEILLLADKLKDFFIKKIAQEYIISLEKQMFKSKEWKIVMENNLDLAAETMHKFWCL
ncbi:hypothetical protein TNIN_496211 [Trichonephila inaurata madagascariensis]|uniref:Uncharacterized protein n=1 Tax=Trichonephila inaurata madagascariensis TaxID=2747483 RepID=A0A8X6WLH9_9ARAC|nr:hypothetical protein TNIN_496211 [Trichonephila inaurata madagascariensis]